AVSQDRQPCRAANLPGRAGQTALGAAAALEQVAAVPRRRQPYLEARAVRLVGAVRRRAEDSGDAGALLDPALDQAILRSRARWRSERRLCNASGLNRKVAERRERRAGNGRGERLHHGEL